MKKIAFAIAVVLGVLFTSCGAKKNAAGWYTDFEAAKKAANSKNKSILLFVHSDYDMDGSDAGVAALTGSSEFIKALNERYVCVLFSFTDLETTMNGAGLDATNAEQKAVEKRKKLLQEQFRVADIYAIQETPSITLITKDGYYITSVSNDFSGSSVDGYVGLVNAEDAAVRQMQAAVLATEKGSASERIAAIDALFESSTEMQRLALVDLSRKLVDLDKKNESGLVSKHLFSIANAESYEKLSSLDFVGAVKIYSRYAEDKRILPVDSQALYFMAASAMARSGSSDVSAVIALLQKSIDVLPDGENVASIKTVMENLQNMQAMQTAMEENSAPAAADDAAPDAGAAADEATNAVVQ